jgi:hypothetical protein
MLPNVASIASYDGPKNDYSAVIDSTTDRSAAGANPERGDVAGMTHTAWRAWAHLTLLSSGGTPILVAHDETWNNSLNAAPTLARTSAGVYTLTYPTTVVDEIPSTSPGYIGPQAVNFRGGNVSDRGATTWYDVKAYPTAANVLTVYCWKFSGGVPVLADPVANLDVDVYAI